MTVNEIERVKAVIKVYDEYKSFKLKANLLHYLMSTDRRYPEKQLLYEYSQTTEYFYFLI